VRPYAQAKAPSWAAYLHGPARVQAYAIAGAHLIVQSSDAAMRRLIDNDWSPCAVALDAVRHPAAILRIAAAAHADRAALKHWRTFVTDTFICISDGRRYIVTADLERQPWQIDCVPLARWAPAFVYRQVIEPLWLDLLKRLGLLVWHGAAVERGGHAILLSGVSGSGKSTTTLRLLDAGYRFIADDVVLLRQSGRGVQVIGWEQALFATTQTMTLLPHWRAHSAGRRYKRGAAWKHRIDLRKYVSRRRHTRPAIVRTVLFPRVHRGRATDLRRLAESEALVACLQQPPKEFPATILPTAIEDQFATYAALAASAGCYRLALGDDQHDVQRAIGAITHDLDR
jgi:hypothetical protein